MCHRDASTSILSLDSNFTASGALREIVFNTKFYLFHAVILLRSVWMWSIPEGKRLLYAKGRMESKGYVLSRILITWILIQVGQEVKLFLLFNRDIFNCY